MIVSLIFNRSGLADILAMIMLSLFPYFKLTGAQEDLYLKQAFSSVPKWTTEDYGLQLVLRLLLVA